MHYDGKAIARVQRRTNMGRQPAKVKFFTTFITPTASGGFIVTGNGKNDLYWPDTHDAVRFVGMDVDGVWARHQERIDAAGTPRITRASSAEVAEQHHTSLRDFHLARGVFGPLGEEELEMIAPPPVPIAPPPLTGESADPSTPALAAATVAPPDKPIDHMENATLDELRKMQRKQTNWVVTALLLVLSGLLFVMNSRNEGGTEQNWEFIATIVGILLFHECGHYVAMKLFGYRNLKMFFIPGFGAAVSGRHYNAAAWKKIVVSLAGPLPGILVGLILLVIANVRHDDLLYRIGLMAVGLNAFNLLPVLPLDGGWVAHAALFARHPKLDIGFRLITALLMITAGFFLPGFKLLMYVGIFSLIALPIAFRRAQIVRELRTVPGIGVSPDNQSIPVDTARAILVRVRDRFRQNLNAKTAAQHVADIFESLNARPPKVLATLGLLTLHAGGFFVAIVGILAAIFFHERANFSGFARGESYPVGPAAIQVVGTPPAQRHLVVLQFKNETDTLRTMSELPPDRPFTRFGHSLLVDFAADETPAERALFERYEKKASDAFVTNDKIHLNANLTFNWPDSPTAKQTFDDLAAYLSMLEWDLTPPWSTPEAWPAGDRNDMIQCRRLVAALRQPPALPDEFSRDFYEKRLAARRRGDNAEVERMDAEQKAAMEKARQTQDADLARQFGHADLIQQWREILSVKDRVDREKQLKARIAPALGVRRPEDGGEFIPKFGHAMDLPGLGHVVSGTFVTGDTGVVHLTQWLIDQGAMDVKYQLEGMPDGAADLDELGLEN